MFFFNLFFLGVRSKVLTSNINRPINLKKEIAPPPKKKSKQSIVVHQKIFIIYENPIACMFTITDWIWNKSLTEYSDFRHTYAFQSINMNNISINEHKYLFMNRF